MKYKRRLGEVQILPILGSGGLCSPSDAMTLSIESTRIGRLKKKNSASHGITIQMNPLSDSPVCKKPRCFQKNTIKHLLTQSSCERVLLTGVITSEKCNPVVDPIAGAVPKLWTCFQFCPSQLAKAIEHSVEPDFPETHNDAQISEKLKFANHERPAIFYFLKKQFVLWRRTAARRGDV